jgi:purine nucleosidase
MSLRPFVLDCDTGRDDALAIWTAIALKLPLSAIVSSYGNVKVEGVTDNTARVVSLAGRDDIPLWSGATQPSQAHIGIERVLAPRQKSSGNGLCNLELPHSKRNIPEGNNAPELAEKMVGLFEKLGPLDYMITGPATNFYQICEALGSKARDVFACVTMMGGKFDALWKQIPGGDFNLICDPYAVRAILKRGFVMRFVPMNATWPIQLPLTALERLVASSPIGAVAKELMIAHCRHFAPEPVFRFHDPSVIIAALYPAAFAPAKIEIICDEKSPDFGRLVVEPAGHDAEIYHTDKESQTMILNLILKSIDLAQPDA